MQRTIPREPGRPEVDRERPYGHPEHRDGERDEGKVIHHRHAEDPRQQDFVHQRGERNEEEADVDGERGRVVACFHSWE